jgi:parallel beta-helix repeat protein
MPTPTVVPPRWRRVVVLLAATTLAPIGATSAAHAADPSASDTFTRSVTDGWGQADTGGAWTVSTPSRFSVTGGVGVVSLTGDGITQRASLPVAGTSTDLVATLAASRVPTGSGLYVSVAGRQIPGVGQYQAKVRWLPDGGVTAALTRLDVGWAETVLAQPVTVPGVSGSSAQNVRVRVQVTGVSPTTIRTRVWQASAAEPTAWTATVTDGAAGWQAAGGVGLDGYLSRSSVPLSLQVDDVAVTGAAPTGPAPGGEPPPVVPPVVEEPEQPQQPPAAGASTARATSAAGAVAVGSAAYPVPSGAYLVSPSGNDAAGGSASAPWRTLGRAVAAAPSGATVVLRAGTYHESVTVPSGKRLTIQAYPGEAVWLDGSRTVTGWVTDGSAWRVDGWTPQFDHSPTYTKGAPDGQGNWGFVNPAYPMAAYPDQLWIDGAAQRQVGSRGAVVAGTFFVDTAADRLYVGTSPAGRTVRATDLSLGLTIRGAGTVVRGIGVQRYATSVPEKGTVISTAPDVTLENVVIRDNATQGLFVGAANGVRNVLRHVTLERNGLLGLEASYADGLVLDGVRAVSNNAEHFNLAPVSGGAKIVRSRGLTVRDSVLADNIGPGLWFDESAYNATITGNDLLRNAGHGLSYEISSRALIADNIVAGNGALGLKINDASNIDIWNNTIVDNGDRPMWLVQDSRQASNLSTPGHDPRQALPDPTVTWLLGPITVKNNVIGGRTPGNCLLCVQDSALYRSAAQIAVTADGNAYHRTSSTSPRWTVTWPVGTTNPQVYTTLAAFRSATGQERNGTEFTGASVVDSAYRLTAAVVAVQSTVAQPLPASVAALIGAPAGERRLGARFD